MLKVAKTMKPPAHVVAATPDLVRPFGDVFATPTMYVFDAKGDAAMVFYGAPPDLHARADRLLGSLMVKQP